MSTRLLALCVVALAGACGPNTESGGDGGHATGDGGMTAKALTVTPQGGTLEVTDLANLPSLAMTATAIYADGTSAAVTASWSVDRYDIASVSGTGVVSPSGTSFGNVKVTASTLGLTASATVDVRLKLVVVDPAVSADAKSKLDTASASDPMVAGLLYPYDKTVFPRALLAPELMWRGGADTDLYRLRITAPDYDLTTYFAAPNPSRYTPQQLLWNALGAAGGATTVELRRVTAAGDAYVSATQQWTIANANLRGTIYYWAVDQGAIVKLDVSSGARDVVFDSGPADQLGTPTPLNAGAPASPPWEANNAGKRCVACHTVSKDGSRLGAVFSRGGSTGPFGAVDLASGAIQQISDYTTSMNYSALTPDGSLTVVNYANKTMRLLDAATGAPIASALDALTDVCDPAFSPDGKRFSMGGSCDPGFGNPIEFRRADLVLYDFDQATRAFSNPRTVRTSTGVGDAIAFPSFSPDGARIFYHRGSYSRAKYGDNAMGQYLHGVDDLYVAKAEQNGAEIALDAANGKGVLPADSLHLNYAPTVNPIAEGGYIWVVFTSPRDYGNRMLSPKGTAPMDATYSNHKQLWVTAVDINTGASDPSHPAFWLPGQDAATTNMFGYWSLSPCKPTAAAGAPPASCTAGFECCSGFCRDTGNGPQCVDAPTGCHLAGEKCAGSGECCGDGTSSSCIAGICQTAIN